MSSLPAVAAPVLRVEQVGSYVLVRRVGSGGMGEVWLGRHVSSGGLGAVKRLSPHARLGARLHAYFEREGRAVARLAHPHIVPVFEVGDGYLVSAFVDGPNLSRRLQTPLEPRDALRIARQIADALAHAHGRGVVHRDVKPSNILVDGRDNAYLTDFGLAGFVGEEETPTVAGTPQWMAPEQRRGEPAGPAADQYALGRTLLVMLAGGAVPVDREAALRELPDALPTRLADAIARATAKDPAHRFPSMAAFAEALATIDLGAAAAPRRLAPEVRDGAPFRWVAGAHRTTPVGPDIVRADFRLRDLAAAGLLADGEAVTGFLAAAGLADVGFAMWAQTARLGPLGDPAALARASDAVILLHGFGVNREAWPAVAARVCRDNAQAIVLAPDLHGFGETTFAGVPTEAQSSLPGLAHMLDGWRRLLGITSIPTAMVGHSMCGVMLLCVDDDQLGGSVARIAMNPVLASHDPTIRRNFRVASRLAHTVGRIGFLRRWAVRRNARKQKDIAALAPAAIDLMVEEMNRMPGGIMAATIRGIARAPTRFGRHRRAAIIVCADDPWLDVACLDVAVAELGLGPAQVHHFPSGGHHPHLECRENPEWSARNLDQIVRIVDSMLITAGEVSTTSPGDASTLPASHS